MTAMQLTNYPLTEVLKFEPELRTYLRTMFGSEEQVEELIQKTYGRIVDPGSRASRRGIRLATYVSRTIRQLVTDATSASRAVSEMSLDQERGTAMTVSGAPEAPALKLR